MSKRVFCYISKDEEDLFWDISGKDLVSLAKLGLKCVSNNDLVAYLDNKFDLLFTSISEFKKSTPTSWFANPVATNSWSDVKPKSRFELKLWWEVWLTDKQKTFVDYRIWMVIDNIKWNWFNWGWVKKFDDLDEVWELKWDAYLYAKDYVKNYVDNNFELDYTCFEF